MTPRPVQAIQTTANQTTAIQTTAIQTTVEEPVPPGPSRAMVRSVAVLLAVGLFAAACGSDPDESMESIESTEADPTTSTVATSEVESDEEQPTELAFDDPVPTTTPYDGSAGPPVTTIPGGGAGDLSIYRGVLGGLTLDHEVTAPVVDPPQAEPGTYPLTGLSGDSPGRPAAVVKIDNSSRARPQAGLNAADIVVEEEVEGGVTRLVAVFHSNSSVVGPVRSGRTTDIGIMNAFGDPLFLYSGANVVTDALIRAQPTVQNRNAGTSSGYWREASRSAPSNLYTDTAPHWASATGGPPPAQFAYRSDGDPVGGTTDEEVTINYRASKASWTWDGSVWLRSQGTQAHLTDNGEQVSAANVVVLEVEQVATGMVDSSGASVPEFVWVGSGEATVFTDGRRIEGQWTRPTLGSVATLTTADGEVIELTPGRTWVQLIGAGSGLLR